MIKEWKAVKIISHDNIEVRYEVKSEVGDIIYEIRISGPELNYHGVPYIGADSPSDSKLNIVVYNTNSEEIKLDETLNKDEIDEVFDVVRWADNESKNDAYHDLCIKRIYTVLSTITTHNVDDISIQYNKIHSGYGGEHLTIYIPYIKSTYKVGGWPYEIEEKETKHGTLIAIIKHGTFKYAIVNDNAKPNKFIPLKEKERLDEYNYMKEAIDKFNKKEHVPSVYATISCIIPEIHAVNLNNNINTLEDYINVILDGMKGE